MSILMGGKNMVSYELTILNGTKTLVPLQAWSSRKRLCEQRNPSRYIKWQIIFVSVLKVESRFCMDFSQFTDSGHLKGV